MPPLVFKVLGMVAVMAVWNSVRVMLFHHGSMTGAAIEAISNIRGAPISSDSTDAFIGKIKGTSLQPGQELGALLAKVEAKAAAAVKAEIKAEVEAKAAADAKAEAEAKAVAEAAVDAKAAAEAKAASEAKAEAETKAAPDLNVHSVVVLNNAYRPFAKGDHVAVLVGNDSKTEGGVKESKTDFRRKRESRKKNRKGERESVFFIVY
jgi:hypothetical protein